MNKWYLMLIVIWFNSPSSYAQDEFSNIEGKIAAYLKIKADTTHNSALKKDGSWSDIDYFSRSGTNWEPLLHLTRIKQLTLQSEVHDKQKIISSLRYWMSVNPKSSNWFQNDIACPTLIGEILVLLNRTSILPVSLRDSLLIRMDQGNVVKAVGANKLDIAVHMIYRACITSDKVLMDFAVNQAFLPINLDDNEGLQPDFSYRQHGPQLQIASYGQVFLIGAYKVASWLKDTSYALSPEKLNILNQYLIHTYLKTIRGRYIDFNTEGRGISRNDVLDKKNITKGVSNKSLLSLAKLVSPQHATVLEEAELRILEVRPSSYKLDSIHSYFYKSDYTIHSRPAYNFNIRTVSKRTIRTETGNKENLNGKFLPDGSTNIQLRGDEYFNIMPIWEWDKVPGITARDYVKDQQTTLEWGERGLGEFTGGVSDGRYGASVYELNYNEVTAKKAWFFFDEEVVCLGAGINSFAKEPIITAVNQAWGRGDVKALFNDKLINIVGTFQSNSVKWVWHDGIGYYFPNGGKINVQSGEQSGSWFNINANRSKEEVKGKVFKLWFNHDLDPVDQTYSYIVKPGVSEREMMNSNLSMINIIANDVGMQAVAHSDLQMVQVVFHKAGSLIRSGYTITVDQPCILLMKDVDTKSPIISVSDPTQKLTDIRISLNGVSTSLTFPQGAHRGATVSFRFK